MLEEKIYTLDELAEHYKVPREAIETDIMGGTLRVLKVAGFVRVSESDWKAYLTGSGSSRKHPSIQPNWIIELNPAENFTHTWPDGKVEKYTNVREGTASEGGANYHVKVGFTFRDSAGKTRRRSLVLIDRYPTVEFVSSGTSEAGMMASIIKDRSGKQVPANTTAPVEYMGVRVGPYQEVVTGPSASNGLAVICNSDDLETMVVHALIRSRYRKDRKQ